MHPKVDSDLDSLPSKVQDAFHDRVELLRTGERHSSTHPLNGPLKGWSGTKLSGQHRMVHKYEGGDLMVLSAANHDEAYDQALRRAKTAMGQAGPDYDNLTFHHGEHPLYPADNDFKTLFAHHPEHGDVGRLTYRVMDHPAWTGWESPTAHVTMMHVDPEHQRRGVASQLMDHFEHHVMKDVLVDHGHREPEGQEWAKSKYNDPSNMDGFEKSRTTKNGRPWNIETGKPYRMPKKQAADWNEYQRVKDSQQRRYETAGNGGSKDDRDAYFGLGEHGPGQEELITPQKWIEHSRTQRITDLPASEHAHLSGWELGRQHAERGKIDSDEVDRQHARHGHSDHFLRGYGEGLDEGFDRSAMKFFREAMAWTDHGGMSAEQAGAKSVRHAGFRGYVSGDAEDEYMEGHGPSEDFDEDLYDHVTPEPTREEHAHYQKHDEYPESYHERHAQAYGEALDARNRESEPDLEDAHLHHFIREHGAEPDVWKKHEPQPQRIDLRQGVYATQSHVGQKHIDKYLHDPEAGVHKPSHQGDYLGDHHPMFVTHEGRLHATEGHHRVAAALQRGDSHIEGWHYNLDKHPVAQGGYGGDGDCEDCKYHHEDADSYHTGKLAHFTPKQKTAGVNGDLPQGMEIHHGGPGELEDSYPYRPAGEGEHEVRAHLDGKPIGQIRWMTHDSPRVSSVTRGHITFAGVHPDYHRRGVASEMLRRAREIDPDVHHSHNLTGDGKAWSDRVAKLGHFTPHLRVFTHTCGLDHRLWGADEKLKPDVRKYILHSMTIMWAMKYPGWSHWSRVYFAGSEASEWTSDNLEGNNDFDVLVGVDYTHFRDSNPAYRTWSNQEITDEMNQGFRAFNGSVMLTVEGIEYGPFDRTTYVNPDSYDIRAIKPYAAYDVGSNEWVVKPPHLPHWSLSELPEATQKVLRATDRLARTTLKLAEPERTQQGAALFDAWHSDRSRAFGPNGEGWWDIANLREKWLDQAGLWAQIVDCKHRFTEGLGAADADWSNMPKTASPDSLFKDVPDFWRMWNRPPVKEKKTASIDHMPLSQFRQLNSTDHGVPVEHLRDALADEWDNYEPGQRHSRDEEHGGPSEYLYHLKKHISEHGLREPVEVGPSKADGPGIHLHDGNHRAVAIHELGIDPVPVKWTHKTAAWNDFGDLPEGRKPRPKSVRRAGFSGFTADSRWDRQYGVKKDHPNEIPDHIDDHLSHFVREHGEHMDTWKKKGTFGPVDLSHGVQATQTHVSQFHIDRYKKTPHDTAWFHHPDNGDGPLDDDSDENNNERSASPMFVTHHGRLHAADGHHRVASILQGGGTQAVGWHYDLDKHPIVKVNGNDCPECARHAAQSHAETQRTASVSTDYPLRSQALTRAHSLFGRGLDALFPHDEDGPKPSTSVPFPQARQSKDRRSYDSDLVARSITHPHEFPIEKVDPRELHATQPSVTRDGVKHYMGGGEGYGDHRLGNDVPRIYHRLDDDHKFILSGHHRATSALLKGEPMDAIVVRGGWGPERK